MNTEFELRVIEVNTEEMIKKLEELGAEKIGDWNQKRQTFESNPKDPNKWIRVRTNGEKSTLTFKTCVDETITGIKELEVEVSDYNKTIELLERAGLQKRRYEENHRIQYKLNGVEIDFDTWPLIPTYMEIEGKCESEVYDVLDKLEVDKAKVTGMHAQDLFMKVYNININEMKELRF